MPDKNEEGLTFRDYNQISSLPDPPTLGEIETCESVLKYCAEANYMTFSTSEFSSVLAKTTNILRWGATYKILDVELRNRRGMLVLETKIDKP